MESERQARLPDNREEGVAVRTRVRKKRAAQGRLPLGVATRCVKLDFIRAAWLLSSVDHAENSSVFKHSSRSLSLTRFDGQVRGSGTGYLVELIFKVHR